MKSREALEYLRERDRYINTLGHIEGILGWDMETVMPEKAADERAEQLGLIAVLMHEARTEEKLRKAVEAIDPEDLGDADKALVREWRRDIERSLKTPARLVRELSEETGRAHSKWLEAREKSDWSIFRPSMERLVALSKEEAECIGDGSYNTLLDLYERGMTEEKIDSLFNPLEKSIHSIMDRLEGKSVDTSFLTKSYDKKAEEEFCNSIAVKMGFDLTRGAIGVVAHPFTTTLGSDDVRVSNRFTDESVTDPIFSIVHETGHALYEMAAALNPEIRGTTLAQGTSMGVHESQSRFWENLMGRSHAFWEYFYPSLQNCMPQLADVSLDSFVRAFNFPQPSAIRVNADELTYSLHIILRYRIEKALFNGSLSVADVPSAWNEMSRKIIRYEVKNDSEGCLQDSHWAGGSFGYFPSYALGNLYGAMFLEKLYSDCGRENVENALRKGDFPLITDWQERNIWRWGAVYEPETLIERVCGSALKVEPFTGYLEEKFLGLYL